MLRFLTAGESHGQTLVVIVEGVPAGLPLTAADLAPDLARRQLGYGRGRRMAIEQDRAEILSGVRHGETIGSPIALLIRNKDWTNWQYTMSVDADPDQALPGARRAAVTRPRPGHADLSGSLKYDRRDLRDVLERASARETAARVAVGAVCRVLLRRYQIEIVSHVTTIGAASLPAGTLVPFDRVRTLAADDDVRCVDAEVGAAMRKAVDAAREAGDTVGGAVEVIARGVPAGLGSYVSWDRKLDGRLAQALMSIHAIKAVGVGLGPTAGHLPGSQVHDEIVAGPATGTLPGIARPTNRAGGLEGGVTNGEDLRVTAWMKPIATLMKPLRSIDLETMADAPATIERSDVCAVPAAAVVAEAMTAFVLADALLEKLGGDNVGELDAAWAHLRDARAARLGRIPEGASVLRPIVRFGGSGLQTAARPVTTFDADLHRLIDDMIDTMYAAPGVGLAAPQVGVALRVCVIDLSIGKRGGELLTLVNPAFVSRDGMQLEEEGCLSLPGFNATVARPAKAVVTCVDRDGLPRTIEGSGLLARALQHEMDHLDGTLFVDRLRGVKRDMILRKVRKLQRTGQW